MSRQRTIVPGWLSNFGEESYSYSKDGENGKERKVKVKSKFHIIFVLFKGRTWFHIHRGYRV